MSNEKRRKKTLAEEIGEKNVAPLLELVYHKRSYTEIAQAMSKVFKTKNAVAGVLFRHKLEIKRQLTALMIQYGPPKERGRSKPFGLKREQQNQKIPANKTVQAPKTRAPEPEVQVPLSPEEEAELLKKAAPDEPPDFLSDAKNALKRRIAEGLVRDMSWEEITSLAHPMQETEVRALVKRNGGIAEFLMRVGYTPRIAKLVEKLRKKK